MPTIRKTFKIGLSNADKAAMTSDIYNDVITLCFDVYDSTQTYNVGDYVVYQDKIYKCTVNNTTGTWNASNWIEANLSDLASVVANKQDTLVSGTNIKTLNGASLLGSGNIDYDTALNDVSTNAVQNKVLNAELTATKDELAQLKSIVYETTIEEDSFTEEHLQESALPLTVNSKSIVFSAGMDNTNIKGRSFVYNQQYSQTTTLTNRNVTLTCGGTNIKTSGTASSSGTSTFFILNVASGNKLLLRKTSGTISFSIHAYDSNDTDIATIDSLSGSNIKLITVPANAVKIRLLSYVASGTTYSDDFDLFIFNLTQSGIDSATTIDEAIALLQQNGINSYEYNEFSTGKIIDSKPTALNVYKNIWNYQVEQGAVVSTPNFHYDTTGNKVSSTTRIRTVDLIELDSQKEYTIEINDNYEVVVQPYDSSQAALGTNAPNPPYNLWTKNKIKFSGYPYYAVAFRKVDQSNITPSEISSINPRLLDFDKTYPLSLPVLRSAGIVQDNTSKVNILVVDLGELTYSKFTDYGLNDVFLTSGIKNIIDLQNIVGLSAMYLQTNQYFSANMPDMSFGIHTNGNLFIRNSSYMSETSFKKNMSGVKLYIPLATPTDQPSITLPENIEIKKGGSIEATYDSTATTPGDFDFQVAIYKPMEE